jgi:hypothetical protein
VLAYQRHVLRLIGLDRVWGTDCRGMRET